VKEQTPLMDHRLLDAIKNDPRHYQIGALTLLLLYGVFWLDFEVRLTNAAVIVVATLLTQYLCGVLWNLPAFDPRSCLISGLSLCLLLRTNELALAVAAAVLAVASKFVLRLEEKHLFNPTNFGLVILMLLTDRVWISAGQWGSGAIFAFLIVCLGGLVVNRAARSDVSLAFLTFYSLILFGRSCWLGEPLSIPAHRLQSGALLLFSFFMISDPKTTPDSRAGRILFALLAALGAGYVQFVLFRTNGLLWSLAACTFAVPWLDRLLPGNRYQWTNRYHWRASVPLLEKKPGGSYETPDRLRNPVVESVSIFSQHP
jgi:Na+-transporting NADH:ubiquinone oxidoreductase subunit NqrB